MVNDVRHEYRWLKSDSNGFFGVFKLMQTIYSKQYTDSEAFYCWAIVSIQHHDYARISQSIFIKIGDFLGTYIVIQILTHHIHSKSNDYSNISAIFIFVGIRPCIFWSAILLSQHTIWHDVVTIW